MPGLSLAQRWATRQPRDNLAQPTKVTYQREAFAWPHGHGVSFSMPACGSRKEMRVAVLLHGSAMCCCDGDTGFRLSVLRGAQFLPSFYKQHQLGKSSGKTFAPTIVLWVLPPWAPTLTFGGEQSCRRILFPDLWQHVPQHWRPLQSSERDTPVYPGLPLRLENWACKSLANSPHLTQAMLVM
jgi:hypothetical protein